MSHKFNERRQKQAIFFTLWKEENNNKLATPIVTCDIKVFFLFHTHHHHHGWVHTIT